MGMDINSQHAPSDLLKEKPVVETSRQDGAQRSLRRSLVYPRGTFERQEKIWPASPFHKQRNETMSRMHRSIHYNLVPWGQNYARAYEFREGDVPGQPQCNMCEFGHPEAMVSNESFESDINQWIAETRQQKANTINLFVCNRVASSEDSWGLSLSRGAFEAVEKFFDLHPSTLPTICDRSHDGLHFVCPTRQEHSPRADDGVWIVTTVVTGSIFAWSTLSLKYNHQKQRTDAFLVSYSQIHAADGKHNGVDNIISPLMSLQTDWSEFRVLPEVCLQVHLNRVVLGAYQTSRKIDDIERRLGAARSWEKEHRDLDEWPQNVEIKQNTANLHTTLADLAIIRRRLSSARQFLNSLNRTESQLRDARKTPRPQEAGNLEAYAGWTEALLTLAEQKNEESMSRAQNQADLLFSIISQKDSYDSISMAQSTFVFTFITALFLPCTLVASIFSMGMFDWQPDADSESASSLYVSDKFWIYWAFSLPLTLLVMGGWYWWSLTGMKMWKRSSSTSNQDVTGWRARSRWVRFLGRPPKSKIG